MDQDKSYYRIFSYNHTSGRSETSPSCQVKTDKCCRGALHSEKRYKDHFGKFQGKKYREAMNMQIICINALFFTAKFLTNPHF